MKQEKYAKLKMHLEGALACLDETQDADEGTAPEHDSEKMPAGDDMAEKSMKMKLMKYK